MVGDRFLINRIYRVEFDKVAEQKLTGYANVIQTNE
jgi:hypothetical protein